MFPVPVNSSNTIDLVISSANDLFTIDLMGTRLEFKLPKRTLNSSEFLRGHPIDLRPYVNTISKSEYRYNPETKRGSCEFYESGWGIYTKKWWKKSNHATLKLLVSLETPASSEAETYPNMFDEDCLKSWLPVYYRDRQAILERTSFSTLDDGSIEVEFLEQAHVKPINPEDVPLKKLPQPVSGFPCYYVYLNPGIVEFNLPIGYRDVLLIRFQIKHLSENEGVRQQVNKEVLLFAERILKSVKINLSEKEESRRTAVQPMLEGNIKANERE